MLTQKKSRKTRPVEDRFAEKVAYPNRDGCLLWLASYDLSGYGLFYLDGKLERAHRVSYLLYYGEYPDQACHTCDVRLCVNPLHIFSGTQSDNMRDMVKKGRNASRTRPKWSQGERNPKSKLSSAQVEAIRALYGTGAFTQTALAKRFGVRQNHISRIVRKEQWNG